MGVLLRQQKQLGSIPLVFVEGDPEKTAQARAELPGALFTSWEKVETAIRKAAAMGPREPSEAAASRDSRDRETGHRRRTPRWRCCTPQLALFVNCFTPVKARTTPTWC